MNRNQKPFGKNCCVVLGSTVYAVFVRHSDGKIGSAPIERIEALIEEELLG